MALSTDTSTFSLSRRTTFVIQANWVRASTVLGCVVLWLLALRGIDISAMNDYGLISIVPAFNYVAIAILTVSFCLALRDESTHDAILLLHIVAMVFMLFGITSLIEPLPRFESTWKHVGVTDYVIRHGSVDPNIDAYFNWPGFFILMAFVTEVTGVKSALSLANWWPVAVELLYLPPLLMIFRRATFDRRLIWLSVWTFYIANWIGQDYLSPQGFNFFLYLVIFAILITWYETATDAPHPVIGLLGRLRSPTTLLTRLYRWIAPADLPGVELSRWQRITMTVIIGALFAAITAGHQLTPFAIIAGAMLLVLFYRVRLFSMPFLMIAVAGLWLRYGASAYWAGHGSQIADQVGALDKSVGSNMTDRLSGSRGHEIVVYIRTAATLAFWGLALVGGLRRLSKGHRDFTFALLAAAPFPLIVAQSYGGEMLLRVYLFALPFMAFFAAAIFYRSDEVGGSLKTTASIVLISWVAIGLFFVTRYGNERQDYFTVNEVAASEVLYNQAPPGSIILTGTVKAPWKYRDYELHKHKALSENVDWELGAAMEPNLKKIASILRDPRYNGGYLFITRSQIANDELFGLLPYNLADLEKALAESPDFVLIYGNPDAQIYVVRDSAGGGP